MRKIPFESVSGNTEKEMRRFAYVWALDKCEELKEQCKREGDFPGISHYLKMIQDYRILLAREN